MSARSSSSVSFRVAPPDQLQRPQVVIRLALLLALGAIGASSLYWALYLALPALAGLLISRKGSERYLSEDGPGIVRVLRWFAAAYAYLWLLTDALPTTEAEGPVELEVPIDGEPSTSAALLRLLYSLPALLILSILSIIASVLWAIGAVVVLLRRRLPGWIGDFLAMTLRYQFRLLAYHLSLVEPYPSFEESAARRVATP